MQNSESTQKRESNNNLQSPSNNHIIKTRLHRRRSNGDYMKHHGQNYRPFNDNGNGYSSTILSPSSSSEIRSELTSTSSFSQTDKMLLSMTHREYKHRVRRSIQIQSNKIDSILCEEELKPKREKRATLIREAPQIISANCALRDIAGPELLKDFVNPDEAIEAYNNITDSVDFTVVHKSSSSETISMQKIDNKIEGVLQLEFDKLFIFICGSDLFEQSSSTKEIITDAAIDVATDLISVPFLGSVKTIAQTAWKCHTKSKEEKKYQKVIQNINSAPQEEFLALSQILCSSFLQIMDENVKRRIIEKDILYKIAQSTTKAFVNFASHNAIDEDIFTNSSNELKNIYSQLEPNEHCDQKIIFAISFFEYVQNILKTNARNREHEKAIYDSYIKNAGASANSFCFEKCDIDQLRKIKPTSESIEAMNDAIKEFKSHIENQHYIDNNQDQRIDNIEREQMKQGLTLDKMVTKQDAQDQEIAKLKRELSTLRDQASETGYDVKSILDQISSFISQVQPPISLGSSKHLG
jgi:uncharacterized protein (UPF0335 family)